MSNASKISQKPKKSVKNVMVQPYDVIWPLIEGESFEKLSHHLEMIDRQFVVAGCEAVTKLLQNGQASALFIDDSFHPKVYAKLIIKMARKQNPSILVVAVPSLPAQLQSTNMMMAIIHQQPEDQSSAIKSTLCWIKEILLQKGYVSNKELQRKNIPRRVAKRPVEEPDKPMTDEEIAKLYILEPVSDPTIVDHCSSTDSVSVSDSRQTGDTVSEQLLERKIFQKCTYVPLKVNKVQGNLGRVQNKKRKKKNIASK